MAKERLNIAIDGPAGAGKSTVAKLLASRLGIRYLDTGAMYRAIGLSAVRNHVDVYDFSAVSDLIKKVDVQVKYENGAQAVYLDGENVNGLIRTEEVSMAASAVSAVPEVRIKLVELQREVARGQSVVLDGRDIGTYVLPDAEFKFFLTATAEERARRRTLELQGRGLPADYETVLKQIIERDHADSTRAFAPLKQAEDALLVDSTGLEIDEVLRIMTNAIDGE